MTKPSRAGRDGEGSIPAFMQIEGRIARPLAPEHGGVEPRNFWTVPPWLIVTIVLVLMAALMAPGFLMDLARAF